MSKHYKRKHRVEYANSLNQDKFNTIKNQANTDRNVKVKMTKKETFRSFIGIIFLILTSPYILTLLVGIYFNSERCYGLADKYTKLKIFN